MSLKTGAVVFAAQGTVQGTVSDARMNQSYGELEYLVTFTDVEGVEQERWFLESQLTASN